MRSAVAAVLAAMTFVPLAGAQKLELKFDALAAKASEKVEVDLDAPLIRHAMQLMSKFDKDSKEAADLLNGMKEIHLRNYEFTEPGAYSEKDLEPLRRQVGEASGWSRVVNVKDGDEVVEIFVHSTGDKVTSCLVLAAEPRELSVVHLSGTLTVAQVKQLADPDVMATLATLGDLTAK